MTKAGPILADPRYLELKDRFAGLIVLLGAMVLSVGLSLWSKGVARPEAQVVALPGATRGVVGWPHSVDAIGTFEAAKRASRPRELRRITLEGVKSDGTIDVVTGPGSLSYLFHNGFSKPIGKSPAEVAAVKAAAKSAHCPRQVIQVRRDGLDSEAELKESRCPEIVSDPLPIPTCGPRELWARAISRGASIRQVAHMEYYRAVSGPAWRMTIPGQRFKMTLSGDCARDLNRREAILIPN